MRFRGKHAAFGHPGIEPRWTHGNKDGVGTAYSADSRIWGFVPLRNIKGKAWFVWLSYDRCQHDIPIFGAFRSGRFATNLYGDDAWTRPDDAHPAP